MAKRLAVGLDIGSSSVKLVQMKERRGGYALSEMSPLAYAKDIRVPTLFVQARRDRWTTVADTQSFYDATPAEKEIWWIEDITHRFKAYNHIGEHPERILEFVGKHC
jgi:dipeptidyl aminopeptidase/acylaminoacyl peptidase